MDYTHVNEGVEVPTDKPVSTLPPAADPTKGADNTGSTNGTGAANTTGGNTQSGKTVNTAEGAAVVVLGTVLFAALGVAFVARKRRESEEA